MAIKTKKQKAPKQPKIKKIKNIPPALTEQIILAKSSSKIGKDNKLIMHGDAPFMEWIEWTLYTVNRKNLYRLFKRSDARKYVELVTSAMNKFDFSEIVWLKDTAQKLNDDFLEDKARLTKWAFEVIKDFYDHGGKFGTWR